jgi:uncharacterized protein YbcI
MEAQRRRPQRLLAGWPRSTSHDLGAELVPLTVCARRELETQCDRRDLGMDDMSERALGEVRSEIASRIVQLQAGYYGKGPTKARTYVIDDLVVVVLEETFTKAERTLVERGEKDAIQQIRRRFQQQMADEFTAIVEQATGRAVRAFLSETNLEADIAVEIFLLGEERTDMAGFEEAGQESS